MCTFYHYMVKKNRPAWIAKKRKLHRLLKTGVDHSGFKTEKKRDENIVKNKCITNIQRNKNTHK